MTQEDCNMADACTWVALAVSSLCEQGRELFWRRLIVMEATAPPRSSHDTQPSTTSGIGERPAARIQWECSCCSLVMILLEAKAFQSINAVTHQGVFLKDFVNLEVYIWLRELWSIQFFMVSLRSHRYSSLHDSHLCYRKNALCRSLSLQRWHLPCVCTPLT